MNYLKWFFYYRFVFARRAKQNTGKIASVALYLSKNYVRPVNWSKH